MTQGCVEFAKSQDEVPDTEPGHHTYVLEITYDIFDPKAFDQFCGGPALQGKSVDSGSWRMGSNGLEYLMDYAESLNLTWRADRLCNPGERFVTGSFQIRREGLPLLALEGGRWAAVGDDYLDPWQEEATSDTEMCLIPDTPDTDAPSQVCTIPQDVPYHATAHEMVERLLEEAMLQRGGT